MKKAVFLDRDGVINKQCYHDEKGIYSAMDLDEFEIYPDVKESINRLKDAGFMVIVITNQAGVAFGYLKKENVEKISEFMAKDLNVDDVYVCYHHPNHTGGCDCRKPKDGMVKQAAKDHDIDVSKSFLVGDNLSDIEAGKKCKKTFLVVKKKRNDLFNLMEEMNINPDYTVKNLEEAVKIILK